MKKKFHYLLSMVLSLPIFVFAADGANPLSKLAGTVNTEIENTTKTVMSIANTITLTLGVAYLIFCFIIWKFSPERGREHIKTIITVGVLLGVIYGVTTAYM